jgi:glycerol-3-phosphate dehydrogenase
VRGKPFAASRDAMPEQTARPDPDAQRAQQLEALAADELDLLIIGGGITGAALAHLAKQMETPLRVGLVEAGELACGTSSRSSGLLHGGLRYLAQGRFGLVRRLLRGRRELADLAPHLIERSPFLLPLGPATPHAQWVLRNALRVYTALGGPARHPDGGRQVERLDARAAVATEPWLADMKLTEALIYNELVVHDARLVADLAMAAAGAGAITVTHARCEGLTWIRDRVAGAWIRDGGTERITSVRAKVVVNATGPWSDTLSPAVDARLRLSRGTHLLIPAARLPLLHTIVIFSPRDGRALFVAPRGDHLLLGTTEVEHRGSPDEVEPSRDEIRYLLEALVAAFPTAKLGLADVTAAFAGVRPLAMGTTADTGALDRDYVVNWDAPGLLAVRGGKLTLALTGARRALSAIARERHALSLPPLAIPRAGQLSPLVRKTVAGADCTAAAASSSSRLERRNPSPQEAA